MRLIDADALPKYNGYALSADNVAKAVEHAPTIDAVEVVRCKDCVRWNTIFDRTKAEYGLCQIRSQPEATKNDDF